MSSVDPAESPTLTQILSDPAGTLLATDFDGTIAPIVADPERALAHPDAVAALARCAGFGLQVAVVTGRPARTAVRLGGFENHPELGSMTVLGQYGVERWDAATGTFSEPEPPAAISAFAARLPAVLATAGLPELHVEDKGRAVAVHTRRASDPSAALEAVTGPVTALATELGLQTEPGRLVLEVRARGMDKGQALTALVAETGVRQVIFCGDDLGDVAGFRAIRAMAPDVGGVLVAAGSSEQNALVELADVVVDGVPGVADWLDALAGRFAV